MFIQNFRPAAASRWREERNHPASCNPEQALCRIEGMENSKPACTRATLYYDGHCPLCTREMASLARLKGDELRLQDIHQIEDFHGLPNKNRLLRNLHLKTADGDILTGVDANVAAWQGTRHGRLLGWMRWPLVKALADAVYRLWAHWRYQRLYGKEENLRQ